MIRKKKSIMISCWSSN